MPRKSSWTEGDKMVSGKPRIGSQQNPAEISILRRSSVYCVHYIPKERASIVGEGLRNGTFCCSSECDSNPCLNGGTCLLSGVRCADQICTCPAGYEGETCSEQSSFFVPVASKANIPKRTVILVLSSIFAFNSTDAECKIQEVIADLLVRRLFNSNSNHRTAVQGGAHLMNVTTQFNYSGVATEIKYLNKQLVPALNLKIEILRAVTATTKIAFIQVIDGNFTSLDDLVPYFSCGDFQRDAYKLNNNTFMCESQCINYCKNGGSCTLTFEGPLCRCVPFSIYTTSGPTCDTIAMNLNAFFGILFGALVFLLLLIIAIVLIVYWRRKKKKSEVYECYDDSFLQTSFYRKTLTGYKNVQETQEAKASRNNPVLVDWKAKSEMGDTSMKETTGQPQRQSAMIYSKDLGPFPTPTLISCDVLAASTES
ncbi:mucin-4-like [Lissotriton helveticus]